MNAISHDSAIGLIQRVMDRGITVKEIYVDTVGIAEKYQEKLARIFDSVPTIVVSKKADSLYPIVSAASIAAKVTRDQTLENWQFVEGPNVSGGTGGTGATGGSGALELGSGYPADPVTKDWLASSFDAMFGWPQLVRFSWQTCKTIIEKDAIDIDWGDSAEEGQKSVTAMWGAATAGGGGGGAGGGAAIGGSVPLTKRYNYHRTHHMHVVTGFPKPTAPVAATPSAPVTKSSSNGGGGGGGGGGRKVSAAVAAAIAMDDDYDDGGGDE